MKNFIHKKNSQKSGITLLVAALTASLLLAISLSIFNLTLKELIISSSGRESLRAFYAADAGAECAIYWDLQSGNYFSTTTSHTISCNGQTFQVGGAGNNVPSVFTVNFSPDSACTTVSVRKNGPDTLIEARGYNTCVLSSRKTERGIKVEY